MKLESAYLGKNIITSAAATMNEEKEKGKHFKCDHTSKQKKQCLCHYFTRIFVFLLLSTNFSLEVSVFLCDSIGNRIEWGTRVRKEKKIKKKHSNIR
jgi:hypothetical protein